MFEKEAEEYGKNYNSRLERKLGFKDGAEFGYNKAKEEINKIGLALQSDMDKTIEQNMALKKELEKDNEWHYVKDKLPPIKEKYNGRSEPVLVLSKEKEMQYAQYVEKEKTWARGICAINFEPFAWKEIVLPNIKED